MKNSPYTNLVEDNIPVKYDVYLFINKYGSKKYFRVVLDDEQFEALQEFLIDMFPPKNEKEIVSFIVESKPYILT